VFKLNDLFNLFDILQMSLYSNDPEANKSEQMSDRQSSVHESQRFTYEESILITILGENYQDFINPDTGEWD